MCGLVLSVVVVPACALTGREARDRALIRDGCHGVPLKAVLVLG